MKIESLAAHVSNAQSIRAVSQQTQAGREAVDSARHDGHRSRPVSESAREDDNKVSPEEILDKIREISEDGLYSVRFEKNEEIDQLVVKLVDRKTEEVIRQIPPETILGIKANLREYAGNIVNQVS
jgi:flagellar protein FlaG